MTEKELISQLQGLKQIKPRQDWVVLIKKQILEGEIIEPKTSFFSQMLSVFRFNYRPAFAVLTIAVLFGLFGFSQNSLPGDFFYPLKKMSERSQALFVSEGEKSIINLELANKRLEELTEIAQTNQTKKLAPAINEFQASISEATKNLVKINATGSVPGSIKGIVEETQKLKENKQKAEALGIVIGNMEDLDNAIIQQIEIQLKVWKETPLTEEEKNLLTEAENYYQEKDYYQASLSSEELWKSYSVRVK